MSFCSLFYCPSLANWRTSSPCWGFLPCPSMDVWNFASHFHGTIFLLFVLFRAISRVYNMRLLLKYTGLFLYSIETSFLVLFLYFCSTCEILYFELVLHLWLLKHVSCACFFAAGSMCCCMRTRRDEWRCRIKIRDARYPIFKRRLFMKILFVMRFAKIGIVSTALLCLFIVRHRESGT